MNLLSNLLEFSNYQPTSLMFCESPKDINLGRNTKEFINTMSARKEQCMTPEKRVASKSLTKLDLLSFSNTKIDPRQRLLHRMVHKINMKCRKHYYNFFVVLENLKKKNITLYQPTKDKPLKNPNLQIGFSKLMQLYQILFSKYFSNNLKKSSFQALAKWSRHKNALIKLVKIINKKSSNESFKAIQRYSKKVEKQEIRMDILIDSIHNIERSINNFHRIAYLKAFMSQIKANYQKVSTKTKKIEIEIEREYFKTPPKSKIQLQQINIKPFADNYSPFSKEKTSNLINSVQQSYQNLKTRKKMNDESPGKPRQPIEIYCEQVKLKIEKCFNYIKNSKCKTNLDQQTIPVKFGKEPQYQISKRCEPISLSFHQVSDLNDKGAIFFHQLFSSIPFNSSGIAESTVKQFHKIDSISQTFSQQLHSTSQVSLITPLTQKSFQSPRKSIASSGVKASAFGSEAVSFKNSLVFERELMKDQQGEEKIRERKEHNFAKIKNQVKNEKRAHDEYFQSESRFKVDNRSESAERDYNSVKFRRQGDFTISIPQGMVSQSANATSRPAPFIKRSSDTPEPDIRSNYNSSERKHLSLMNSNKVQISQEDGKRSAGATYLKILSKK